MATKSVTAKATPSPKKNKHQPKDRDTIKPLLGKRVLYIGMGGKTAECTQCGSSISKGMISEFEKQWFCNDGCIDSHVRNRKV